LYSATKSEDTEAQNTKQTKNDRLKYTSKTPRHRPRLPLAPASSCTSRRAATRGSSVGSMPPPGTIHKSCLRLAVTSNTYQRQPNNQLLTHTHVTQCHQRATWRECYIYASLFRQKQQNKQKQKTTKINTLQDR